MLIFYRKDKVSGQTTPLVLLDALCTDDFFTVAEIAALSKSGVPRGVVLSLSTPKVFSTQYECVYSQNGLPVKDTKKTYFSARVMSPPAEFVSAFSPEWFLSSQTAAEMSDAENRYASPETAVTYGTFIVRDAKGEPLQFNFVAYKGEMSPDPYGTTATLSIIGAADTDIFLTGKDSLTLYKNEPLKDQITDWLSQFKIKAKFKVKDQNIKPVSAMFFPPNTPNAILNDICWQNKLVHGGVDATNAVNFHSQGPAGQPNAPVQTYVSFIGAAGAHVANNFAISEYAKAQFSVGQYFAIKPFDSLLFINDTRSDVFTGASKDSVIAGFDAFRYYVLNFTYAWSREVRELKILGTNNWLLGQRRAGIDRLLENDIYRGAR